MALKLKIDKLEDVDESLRKEYKELNGEFVLQVDGMAPSKTDADVQRLTEALNKEREAHKLTKETVKVYRDLGDLDEVREKLEEAETLKANGGKVSNEEILTLKKQLRDVQKEYKTYKDETEPIKNEYGELKVKTRRGEVMGKIKEYLAGQKELDSRKMEMYYQDLVDSDMISFNEIGDLVTKTGQAFSDRVNRDAELFNFKLSSTPSITPANGGNSQVKQADAFKEAQKNKDVMGMIVHANAIPNEKQ